MLDKVLQGLIKFTKEDKIKWKYIDQNEKILSICNERFSRNALEKWTPYCFYTEISYGYFILLEKSPRYEKSDPNIVYIAVLPALNKRWLKLDNTNQSELVRLHNLVKFKFPDVEEYLRETLECFEKL